MICLPESGGCERPLTDPFVAHINRLDGSTFSFVRCLDHPSPAKTGLEPSGAIENKSEPETLYQDGNSHARLVVERKTVVWPLDYAARHQNDHRIARVLLEELRDLADQQGMTIRLEPAHKMKRNEVSRFAHEIAASIRRSIQAIRNGQIVSSEKPGLRWSCYFDPYRAVSDEPLTGLIIRWVLPATDVTPDELPSAFTKHVQKLFASAVKKFRGYSDARRVLLLDPHGDVRYTDGWWWRSVLKTVPVPAMIPEVWLARYDWITDYDQGWEFERIHPRLSPRYSELDGPPCALEVHTY